MDIHHDLQTPRDATTRQPRPTPNDSQPIYEMVIADIRERAEIALPKYGTYLQAHNGRNALQDAYEEALDLAHYLRQEMVERKAFRDAAHYKYGIIGEVLAALQDGVISRGKAAQSIAEVNQGKTPNFKRVDLQTIGDDEIPSETIVALAAYAVGLREALEKTRSAIENVRHWHNTGKEDEGTIISSKSFFRLHEVAAEIDAALALPLPDAAREVEEWKADAERYRHIRAHAHVTVADVSMQGVHYHMRFSQTFVRAQLEHIEEPPDRFDAVVDAALRAAKENAK